MKKIGITGSLASGKTTASKILSRGKRPFFSADDFVKKLYNKASFKNRLLKDFGIKNKSKIKDILREKIINNISNLKRLEKIIHPLVRREMKIFIKKNKRKKLVFFEIPLLIESRLMHNFDAVIFIKAKKSIRLRRFITKGGNKKLFVTLNKKQLTDAKKIKFSDYVVVNESNIKILKKKLLAILKNYE